MASDPFALLGLPRRPWLEEEAVRTAFQQRAKELHPDAPGGNADDFAELNAARLALGDPASRLKVLLDGKPLPGTPPDGEFGFRLAVALRQAGDLARKSPANPLVRALAAGEVAAALETLRELSDALAGKEAAARERLREADAAWPATDSLGQLAAEFVFLARWRAQLREAELSLRLF